MEGYLLIDKPVGWTSFDVVAYVRKQAALNQGVKPRQIKVGHSGTLDPFASGLLILLIGKNYTKKAGDLLKKDKTYDVKAVFGQKSTTGDIEGNISIYPDAVPPTLEQVKTVFNQFTGEISQIPPSYSAIKVNGTRAYVLARNNQAVDLKPRKVIISQIKLTSYKFPIIVFSVRVSSGTYIRALVEDIGTALNCGAYTKQLRRTAIGKCSIANAVEPSLIDEHSIDGQLIKQLFV